MKKRIGIITPGGDAPGINACIRSVVRAGMSCGYEIYGIRRGYSGLLEEDIVQLTARSVSGIVHHGGTILKSARCKKIRNLRGINEAGRILKKHDINWLIVIGGDGSLAAGLKISETNEIPITGIPASIDNDVYGTDETIGFDTAIDTAIDAIDKIRDTATSFERIFVIEVMGRKHGFLALHIAVASGAEFAILPELKFNINEICRELIKGKQRAKSSAIIIFAEGAGNPYKFAEQIQSKTGLEVRVSSLGYIQRGGAPSARSRILGAQFGIHAIELVKRKLQNRVVVIRNGKITNVLISKIVGKGKSIDTSLYRLLRQLAK